MMDSDPQQSNYRWYLLGLAMVTNALAVAAPSMAMPVLFEEIARDLQLDLVQIGLIWGITALPGVFTILLGGAIGDWIGPKRVLVASCLAVGLSGGLRGLSFDFASLAATMFLFGLFSPFIVMNNFKTSGMWFSGRQLGLASGVLSMGMALGFLLGSMFSATLLSPWLGGWRNVMYFYGALSLLLAIPWALTRARPDGAARPAGASDLAAMPRAIRHVLRIRNIWLFGLTIFGISGCLQGALGYLPLYLRGLGWAEASADGALAIFHTISMIFVIPIALGSDRLGTRKNVLVISTLLIIAGIGLLSVANGVIVWVAVLMAGMVRDGFMAIFMTSIIETKGVGVAYAGTATGTVMMFSGIGNLIAPPIGNSLAAIGAGLPFVFWAFLALIGLGGLLASTGRSTAQVWQGS